MQRSVSRLVLLAGMLSAAVASAQTNELDHLLCYRMRDPLTAHARFDLLAKLQPEFSRAGCTLAPDDDDSVRSQFCVPASKVNVDADGHHADLGGPPLSTDYVCYRIDCPPGVNPPNKIIEDQFGRRAVRFGTPARLCVPARKEPLPCSPTGSATSPQCGGECPDPSQRCHRERATGLCTCEPTECRGRPDAAGMCGGVCPDSTRRCVRNADNRCVCEPRGCGVDPTTFQCSGECPTPGEICSTTAAGDCGCAPVQPMCEKTAAGTCGGPCPIAGEVCASDASGACRCLPPPPPDCGRDATGECAGPCPPGRACAPLGTACACLPSPPQCSNDPASGACGGPCPAGLACVTRADGICGCEAGAPCGFDPTNGRCGGVCPNGGPCAPLPGTTQCQCVTLP